MGFEGRRIQAVRRSQAGANSDSPRVLMAVEDTVTVEPVGEFELDGIRRPVAAYNVVAAQPRSFGNSFVASSGGRHDPTHASERSQLFPTGWSSAVFVSIIGNAEPPRDPDDDDSAEDEEGTRR
jgi:hypothetical protein